MGSTDYGTQTLGFDYNQSATAQGFNGVYYNAIPTGIYSGFTLTRSSNTLVVVASGLCVISDSDSSTITKVSTSSTASITVSSSIPYIVFRFSWSDSTNNYMDMKAVAYDDIEDDDLIVGRCIYDDDGTTLQTTFDYTRRSTVFVKKFETQNDYFRVYQTEPASNQVTITGGVINTSEGTITVSGGTFPTDGFDDTTNGRVDLIYINEDGDIEVLEGTDASSPSAPRYANRKVIAEITRGASETTVKGNEITRVITSFDAFPISSDMLITDSGGYYTSTDVEDALQELAGSDFTFSGTKTFDNIIISGLADNVSETITGASGQNIQVIKKYGDTTVQYIDQNGKLYNTIGISLAFSDTYSKYTTDEVGTALNQIAGGDMSISGTKTFVSMPILGSSTTVGSSIKPIYLSSGRLTASTSTVGSSIIPIYLNSGTATASTSTIGSSGTPIHMSSGTLVACTVDSAPTSGSTNLVTSGGVYSALTSGMVTKLGTSTIGSSTVPIYLSSGTATASTGTVGSGIKPIYMSSGTLTVSSSTVGSITTPVYLSSGTITALSTTIGSDINPLYLSSGSLTASTTTVGSGIKPIYLSSGTITASTSSAGSANHPVYLSSGTITACSSTVGSSVIPIYMSSGTMTASTSTVGSGTKPIYLNSGTLTVSTSTVGSGIKPIYLSSGALTASSSTVGTSGTPVYLNSGTLIACTVTTSPTESSTNLITSGAVYDAVDDLEPSVLVIPNVTADPSSPVTGQIWFRTDL